MQNIFIKPRFPLSVINVYLINVASEQSIIERKNKLAWSVLYKENNIEFFMMFFGILIYLKCSTTSVNKTSLHTFVKNNALLCSGWNLSVFFFTQGSKMKKIVHNDKCVVRRTRKQLEKTIGAELPEVMSFIPF